MNTIETITTHHVTIDGTAVTWADLRRAASAANEPDLRGVYADILDQARTLARRAGLMGWRVSGADGEVQGPVHVDRSDDRPRVIPSERERLRVAARDAGYDWHGAEWVRVTHLDPDQLAEAQRGVARAEAIDREIREAQYPALRPIDR